MLHGLTTSFVYRANQELRSLERKAFSPNGIEVDRQILQKEVPSVQ